MKAKKLTIGQKVLLMPKGNALRTNSAAVIIEAEVVKVGKKHFYLKPAVMAYGAIDRTPFDLETFQQINKDYAGNTYISNYTVYTSMKEIEDEEKRPIVLKELTAKLAGMSVDRLIELNKIIVL